MNTDKNVLSPEDQLFLKETRESAVHPISSDEAAAVHHALATQLGGDESKLTGFSVIKGRYVHAGDG